MGSSRRRNQKLVADYLDLLTAIYGKDPIVTRHNLQAEIEAKEAVEDKTPTRTQTNLLP